MQCVLWAVGCGQWAVGRVSPSAAAAGMAVWKESCGACALGLPEEQSGPALSWIYDMKMFS